MTGTETRLLRIDLSSSVKGQKNFLASYTEIEDIVAIEVLTADQLSNFPASMGGGAPAAWDEINAAAITLKDSQGQLILDGHPVQDLNRNRNELKPHGKLMEINARVSLNQSYVAPAITGAGSFSGGIALVLYIKS